MRTGANGDPLIRGLATNCAEHKCADVQRMVGGSTSARVSEVSNCTFRHRELGSTRCVLSGASTLPSMNKLLTAQYDALQQEHAALKQAHAALEREHVSLQQRYAVL